MHLKTNGFKHFSKTNSSDPIQRVPLNFIAVTTFGQKPTGASDGIKHFEKHFTSEVMWLRSKTIFMSQNLNEKDSPLQIVYSPLQIVYSYQRLFVDMFALNFRQSKKKKRPPFEIQVLHVKDTGHYWLLSKTSLLTCCTSQHECIK